MTPSDVDSANGAARLIPQQPSSSRLAALRLLCRHLSASQCSCPRDFTRHETPRAAAGAPVLTAIAVTHAVFALLPAHGLGLRRL